MRPLLPLLTLFSLLLIGSSTELAAQEDQEGYVFLRNPSFEDLPRNSSAPIGWLDCGFPGETPPDVHPDPKNEFRVSMPAQHGKTFMGLVTRSNDTWERVGQKLSVPVIAGQCYELRIRLARSNTYLSRSRTTMAEANYVEPIKLRIHGGYNNCQSMQVMGESEIVSNYDWREFRIKLEPQEDFTHILLEAYYNTPILVPYNGNVLVDNASPLVPIECEKDLTIPAPTEEIVAEAPVNPEDEIEVTTIPKPRKRPAETTSKSPVIAAVPDVPRIKLGETEATLKEGQVFAIEEISFKANSYELESESETALQEIVGFMKENDNVVIEIGGHASYKAGKQYANNISDARAKEVIAYLRTHSIGSERMFPKGYGKSRPVCIEDSMECNKKNQRVEVKILKLKETK